MTPQNIIHAHLYGGPQDGLDLVVCPQIKCVPPSLLVSGEALQYHHRKQDPATGIHIYAWPGSEKLANLCQISTTR